MPPLPSARSLPICFFMHSAFFCFVECPIKSTRQTLGHSVKLRIVIVSSGGFSGMSYSKKRKKTDGLERAHEVLKCNTFIWKPPHYFPPQETDGLHGGRPGSSRAMGEHRPAPGRGGSSSKPGSILPRLQTTVRLRGSDAETVVLDDAALISLYANTELLQWWRRN